MNTITRTSGDRETKKMNGALKQVLLIGLFVALIGVVLLIRYYPTANPAETTRDPVELLRKYGFYFDEVSKQCGIDF